MPDLSPHFGLLPPELTDYRTAQSVVLPLPFERTTSYGKGTALGPRAILQASYALELYDEELAAEPCAQGIFTLPAYAPEAFALEEALAEIKAVAHRQLSAGKFLVTLGGEHSLTLAPVQAAQLLYPELGVVQFDAHADLRDDFEGTPYSHACVMRRIRELGVPVVSVGLRSLSAAEARWLAAHPHPVLWGHELPDVDARFAEWIAALPETVYLTFDIDYFDPSLVPATGTPEPGGGLWYPTLRLLRQLFTCKRVVAMDVVELAPIGGQPASDFLTAKLIYKCLGYRWQRSLTGRIAPS